MDSLITTQNKVDPPVALTSTYRFNAQDRQFIDNQVRGCEQHLASSLINGVHATWFTLDGSSAAVVVGDVVCSASTSTTVPTATKATSGALATAGAPLGVCLSAASSGGMVLVALSGLVAKTITGLAASALGVVRVSSSARCEKVTSLTAGDFLLGSVDSAGFLSLGARPAYSAGGASPAGSTGDLQMKNGSALAASHINDDGSNIIVGAGPGGTISLKVNGTTVYSVNGSYSYQWVPLYFPDTSTPASTGTGGVMWSAGGYPFWIDNTGFSHQLAEYRICLNANFGSAATITVQSVTNMSFPAVAGEVWEVEFGGWTSQASGVAGVAFGFNGSATFTQEGVVEGSTTSLAAYTAAEMTASATGYGALNTVAATKGTVWGKTVITVTASGIVNLAVKPLGAQIATLYAGFSMTAKRIKKV